MTMATPTEVETEIRAIMKARVEAVHAKDAARLVAHHASDVEAYDLGSVDLKP
jgi:ketosteroid isomerase-like protein